MKKVLLLSVFIGCGLLVMRNFYAADDKKKHAAQQQLSQEQVAELGAFLGETAQLPLEMVKLVGEYANGGYEYYGCISLDAHYVGRKIAFSPDEKYIAVVREHIGRQHNAHYWYAIHSQDNNLESKHDICIYATASKKLIKRLKVKEDRRPPLVTFNPDGTLLAYVSQRAAVGLLDYKNNKVITKLQCELNPIAQLQYNADGSALMFVDTQGGVFKWELKKGEEQGVEMILKSSSDRVSKAVFSPDGSYLAVNIYCSMSGRSIINVYHIPTKALMHRLSYNSVRVSSMSFSCDNTLLAVGDAKKIYLADLSEDKPSFVEFLVDKNELADVFFSPHQVLLALVLQDGRVKLWRKKENSKSWENVENLVPSKGGHAQCGSFSHHGQFLAVALKGCVDVWCKSDSVQEIFKEADRVHTIKIIKKGLVQKDVDPQRQHDWLRNNPDLYRQAAEQLIKEGRLNMMHYRQTTFQIIEALKQRSEEPIINRLKEAYPEYFQ